MSDMQETTKDAEQFTGASKLPTLIGAIGIVLLLVLLTTIDITRGTIMVDGVQSGSTIYINRAQQLRSAPDGSIEFSLPPGEHTVILSNDGFWPWREQVEVQENEIVHIKPFLTAREPQPISEVASISNPPLEFDAPTPTQDQPIYSDDDQVIVWIEDRKIHTRWTGDPENAPDTLCSDISNPEDKGAEQTTDGCELSRTVYDTTPVHQVDFYPERHDVLIFSDSRGVYAIELDPSPMQNFQPIYQRATSRVSSNFINTPEFTIENGNVFIHDQGRTFVSPLLNTSGINFPSTNTQ